jgi:hypothetical protein
MEFSLNKTLVSIYIIIYNYIKYSHFEYTLT